MFKNALVLFLFILVSQPMMVSGQEVPVVKKWVVKKKHRKVTFKQISFSLIQWQEFIKGQKSGIANETRTQSQGIQFRYGYNIPFRGSKWRHAYFADFSFGTLKGTIKTADVSDELRNQYWLSAAVAPALLVRTTPSSEIGLAAPMTLRLIRWNIKKEGDLLMQRTSSFSPGLSFIYLNRFTNRSILNVSLTHQFGWHATQWTVGYEYRFN